MKASDWNGGGDEQDNRVTADLLQTAFNLGPLTENEGNVSNCGTDGVFILCSTSQNMG
jgi:hypothetical protein